MHVIGTAGHVDHGKSTLVAKLTGINPDRLKEEREREMTIDLGFAWMTLPSGEEIGIVDVPGHRDFIENMLAGVGGIDAAMLIIAADEGIMPQTREHLTILDLIQISRGFIVVTKIDLVKEEPGWLDLIEADIRSATKSTFLDGAKILYVSSRTGEGIQELIQTIDQTLSNERQDLPSHNRDLGRPRLPIDRVFSIAGFGTVITGTLTDGCLSSGDEVEILPPGIRARIRGLQTHKKNTAHAQPGTRTAINVSGVGVDQIHRGDVLINPGQYEASRRIDVRVRLLNEILTPFHHGDEIKFFTGTSETIAKVRLLGIDSLAPGQTGWVQLELRNPIVCARGDRFILRRPSPGETLGGGQVVDPHPAQRHKRFDQNILQQLETGSQGSPAEILMQRCLILGPMPEKDLLEQSHLDMEIAKAALAELHKTGLVVKQDEFIIPTSSWNVFREKTLRMLDEYHKEYPLRRGISREELKNKTAQSGKVFSVLIKLLSAEGSVQETGAFVSLAGFSMQFSPTQEKAVAELLNQFVKAPVSPPTYQECKERVGKDVLDAMLELGLLIQISQEVLFSPNEYKTIIEKIRNEMKKKGTMTLAEVRDLLDTSRRYVQALLEHMDTLGITVRNGDVRHLK